MNLNKAGRMVYVSNTVDDIPIKVVKPIELIAGWVAKRSDPNATINMKAERKIAVLCCIRRRSSSPFAFDISPFITKIL
jgi:hypothetical protein